MYFISYIICEKRQVFQIILMEHKNMSCFNSLRILKITFLKSHSDLPGANELNYQYDGCSSIIPQARPSASKVLKKFYNIFWLIWEWLPSVGFTTYKKISPFFSSQNSFLHFLWLIFFIYCFFSSVIQMSGLSKLRDLIFLFMVSSVLLYRYQALANQLIAQYVYILITHPSNHDHFICVVDWSCRSLY